MEVKIKCRAAESGGTGACKLKSPSKSLYFNIQQCLQPHSSLIVALVPRVFEEREVIGKGIQVGRTAWVEARSGDEQGVARNPTCLEWRPLPITLMVPGALSCPTGPWHLLLYCCLGTLGTCQHPCSHFLLGFQCCGAGQGSSPSKLPELRVQPCLPGAQWVSLTWATEASAALGLTLLFLPRHTYLKAPPPPPTCPG